MRPSLERSFCLSIPRRTRSLPCCLDRLWKKASPARCSWDRLGGGDHEEGIRDVLEKNAAYGVLSTFIGMTADSRSLLSFVRHDYFRRVLCKWVAEKIAAGAFPNDESLLRPLLENICYRNAKAMVTGRARCLL